LMLIDLYLYNITFVTSVGLVKLPTDRHPSGLRVTVAPVLKPC